MPSRLLGTAVACLAAWVMGSCTAAPRQGPLQVSVIGEGFGTADPNGRVLSGPDAVLAQATLPGLVRFDAGGQVIPALGESWITTTDGLSTIFRLHDLHWPGGRAVTGQDIAAQLDAAMAMRSRNALKPLLTAVEGVVGMTDRVVEIRLKVPRPNLLQLFAQPELGVVRLGQGLSGWRVQRLSRARVRLHPALASGDGAAPPNVADGIDLRAERAARAIAGFDAGASDLVLGGTVADWPVVRAARVRPARLRFDPAQGLFGVAIVGRSAFLADVRVRQALAMAVDRPALAAMLALPGWEVRDQLLPDTLDSARVPARPDWSSVDLVERRVDATRRIATWTRVNGAPPTLTIALPNGPGWRLVLARLTADWGAIGVTLRRVQPGEAADMRVIDAVAPNASANWFLSVTACEAGLVCDATGDLALGASRAASTLAGRAQAIADADDASTERSSFIALGAPIRWALVDPVLTQFRENALAVHPLDQLQRPR